MPVRQSPLPNSLDNMCEEIISNNPSMMIPWFIMACVAYEKHDSPILTDAFYDIMSRRMAQSWRTLMHRHKNLIHVEDPTLFKGSSVSIEWSHIPSIVYDTTQRLINIVNPQ